MRKSSMNYLNIVSQQAVWTTKILTLTQWPCSQSLLCILAICHGYRPSLQWSLACSKEKKTAKLKIMKYYTK